MRLFLVLIFVCVTLFAQAQAHAIAAAAATEPDHTSTSTSTSIKPPFFKKAENARWLAHTNVWGTISTTSLHLKGQAWGMATSFVDGTTSNSTGNIYMYKSDMDTSVQVSYAVALC
jgi:hypothetical protein